MIRELKRRLHELASRDLPPHLRDGQRGEDLAYELLCNEGFQVVARNYRSRSGKGEVDLLGVITSYSIHYTKLYDDRFPL